MRPSSKSGVFADEPCLSIEWDGERNFVYAVWQGVANRAEFRASLLRIDDAIRDRIVAELISDNRRLEGVANADQLWIRDKIASEETLSRIGKSVFATRMFTTVSEATEWAAEI